MGLDPISHNLFVPANIDGQFTVLVYATIAVAISRQSARAFPTTRPVASIRKQPKPHRNSHDTEIRACPIRIHRASDAPPSVPSRRSNPPTMTSDAI